MFESFGNWVAFDLIGLSPGTRVGSAVQFFSMDITKIFLLLVAVIYSMGWLRSLIRPERIRAHLAGFNSITGRLLAILLGAVTPFCSCSSVPLFIGFLEARIPLGITFAFLFASPMINEIAVVLLASVAGWQVAATYVTAGIIVAFGASLVVGRLKPERWVEPFVWHMELGMDAGERDRTWREGHAFAAGEVRSILGKVWIWVIAGIGLGAALHGYLPTEWVLAYGVSEQWYAVPLMVLLGVPLYSDITATIPIAEALLGKGMALGTTLALIMSIAVLSLPELLILRKVLLWPLLVAFVTVVAIAIMLVGWTINAIYQV